MTAPLAVRIERLVIHASSAREGRALADALPAAFAQALTETAHRPLAGPAAGAGPLDAGSIRMPAGAPGLADAIARQVVDAVLTGRPPR